MPTLRHCAKSGDHKAKVAAMKPGQTILVSNEHQAHGIDAAARHMGRRVSVRRVVKVTGYKVTLLR